MKNVASDGHLQRMVENGPVFLIASSSLWVVIRLELGRRCTVTHSISS